MPVGVPGDLYIGGVKLAREYLNRPEMTAERFVPDPFKQGGRLYKTGDLAIWRADGNLVYLGRTDNQVKIRGFRIELGEIETALSEHPGVKSAVVVAREDTPGDKRLVAYVVFRNGSVPDAELRDLLQARVPAYMVPSVFVMLDALPLTPNGKVDRKALPKPDSSKKLADTTGTDPATETQRTVAGIMASLLGVQKVYAESNFFDLGGHSLLGTQLIAKVRKAFGIRLPLRKVFEAPTVAQLSDAIKEILIAEIEAMSEEEAQNSEKTASK
jgi:acyl carrier protein